MRETLCSLIGLPGLLTGLLEVRPSFLSLMDDRHALSQMHDHHKMFGDLSASDYRPLGGGHVGPEIVHDSADLAHDRLPFGVGKESD